VSDPADPEELAWWRDPGEAVFWTAQSAVPGETFVGTSTGNIGAELGVDSPLHQARDALYVFPDRQGTQRNPPDLTTAPDNLGDGGSNDGTDGNTGDAGSGNGTDTAENGGENTTNVDDDGPGFGVGTTLAGVGGAGYLLARRLERDNNN